MKIACLAWGSLIWKPGALQIHGQWHGDGPEVPIEFSRVADGGELSTAICLGAACVQVLWGRLSTDSLEQACGQLAQREGIPPDRLGGVGTLLVHDDDGAQGLNRWALDHDFDAVIWTALPPRYLNIESRIPTAAQAIAYLADLDPPVRDHARDYIQQVPSQIATAYRRLFANTLGW